MSTISDYEGQAMVNGRRPPVGHQQITSLSSAASLTVPVGARVALIQAQDQNVRWRDDGTNPTTSVGSIIYAGDSIWYDGDLDAIKLIETTTSAKLNVSYYR